MDGRKLKLACLDGEKHEDWDELLSFRGTDEMNAFMMSVTLRDCFEKLALAKMKTGDRAYVGR